MGISMFVSIVGTIIVLILSIITITKGYGFKHTVDDLPTDQDDHNHEEQSEKQL